MINTLVYANLSPFISLLIFLVFIRHNHVFDKKQTKLFFLCAGITLCMLGVVSLDYITFRWNVLNELFPSIYMLRRVTSFLNFTLSPIIPMIIFHIYAAKKVHYAMYIPSLINFIVNFFSMFYNIVFYIDPTNTYDRGPLFFLPFMITIFYMGSLIIQPGHTYTKSKRTERLFLILVVCILSVCMYLEVAEHFLFLTWDLTAVCLILYYLLLNIHRTIIDPLTSTYNRLAYNKEMEKINQTISFIFAFIDINDFKEINDQRGHDVGDEYLQKFAILLEQSFTAIENVYRIGGDEFVVLAKKATTENLKIV